MEENSHTISLFIFSGSGGAGGDKACLWEVRTSGRLSSEGAGCGGGLVPDGPLGSKAPDDPKSEV